MFECLNADQAIPTDQVSVGINLPPIAEPKKGVHVRKRVLVALRAYGDHELADEYERCNPRDLCRLHHCDRCRGRWFYSALNRVNETKALFYGSQPYHDIEAKRHMRHVTGLVALVRLSVRAIKAAIKECKKGFQSFSKKFKNVPVLGFYEIELINVPMMVQAGACPEKRRTLEEMLGRDLSEVNEVMALVHWHVLMFFRGGNGDEEKVQKWLRKHYPHRRQVRIDPLRWEQDLSDSLKKLAGYPLKNRHRYNLSFDTHGYENGNYIRPKELSFLVKLSREVPISEMKIRLRC